MLFKGGGQANLMLCGPWNNITPNSKLTIPILSFFEGGEWDGVLSHLGIPSSLLTVYLQGKGPSHSTIQEHCLGIRLSPLT